MFFMEDGAVIVAAKCEGCSAYEEKYIGGDERNAHVEFNKFDKERT
jgi:hypothetical protein